MSERIKNIKPARWMVIAVFLTAGYFVYQDYAEQKKEREFCEGLAVVYEKYSLQPEVFAQFIITCAKYLGGAFES